MPTATHLTDGGVATSLIDFLTNKWLPFAITNCGFVANRYAGAALTAPNGEILTHKGTIGAPVGPFVFLRTINDVTTGDWAWVMTGTGVDTARPAFDQPGNPAGGPRTATYTAGALDRERCNAQRLGPFPAANFAGHYLFAPADGSYCYAAIQVAGGSTPDWRHFWVGDLTKAVDFSGDAWFIHADSFYSIDPDAPYSTNENNCPPHQITNFSTNPNGSPGGLFKSPTLYAPGLRTDAEFYGSSGVADTGALQMNSPSSIVASKVNNASNYADMGIGAICGFGESIGGTLFPLAANLSAKAKPLIPLNWFVQFDDGSGTFLWGHVGTLPDVYRINMEGLDANEQLTLGGLNYRVYPLRNHIPGASVSEPYSGFEGICIREIA